jgi:hypothetical protein
VTRPCAWPHPEQLGGGGVTGGGSGERRRRGRGGVLAGAQFLARFGAVEVNARPWSAGCGSHRMRELAAAVAMVDQRAAVLSRGRRHGRSIIAEARAVAPRFEAKPPRSFNVRVRRPWYACAAGAPSAPRVRAYAPRGARLPSRGSVLERAHEADVSRAHTLTTRRTVVP